MLKALNHFKYAVGLQPCPKKKAYAKAMYHRFDTADCFHFGTSQSPTSPKEFQEKYD